MQDIRPKYLNLLHLINLRTQNKKIFTPFMLFAGEIRDQVTRDLPNGTFIERGAEIASRWEKLTAEQKKELEKRLQAEPTKRERQTTSNSKLNSTSDKPPKKKHKRDPAAPKQPCTSFMFFCHEKRKILKEDNPDLSISESGKLLGQMWRGLTDTEKQKYISLADIDKKRYSKEMEEYNRTKNLEMNKT